MKWFLIHFCPNVFFFLLQHSEEYIMLTACLHLLFSAALQNSTSILFVFLLEFLCSIVVYLLDYKKCSPNSQDISAQSQCSEQQKIWLSCRSFSAFLSPQSRKGTSVLPWMGDSVVCCCLHFFPVIWLFWCQEIRNPHTLVYAKQTSLECQRMQFQRPGTSSLCFLEGKAVPL